MKKQIYVNIEKSFKPIYKSKYYKARSFSDYTGGTGNIGKYYLIKTIDKSWDVATFIAEFVEQGKVYIWIDEVAYDHGKSCLKILTELDYPGGNFSSIEEFLNILDEYTSERAYKEFCEI